MLGLSVVQCCCSGHLLLGPLAARATCCSDNLPLNSHIADPIRRFRRTGQEHARINIILTHMAPFPSLHPICWKSYKSRRSLPANVRAECAALCRFWDRNFASLDLWILFAHLLGHRGLGKSRKYFLRVQKILEKILKCCLGDTVQIRGPRLGTC